MKKRHLFFLSFITGLTICSCGNHSEDSTLSKEESIYSSISVSDSIEITKRPVWLIAHHCNSNYVKDTGVLLPEEERDVYQGLTSGCNGVEIDLGFRSSDEEIVLFHPGEEMDDSETLTQFLSIPEMDDSRMTMVIYDIKEPEYIDEIVEITHAFYEDNQDNQKVYFVYSLSALSDLEVDDDPYKRFRDVAPLLWPNEALAIDYENDADEVQAMFNDIEFTRGIFGNGLFNGQARGSIESSCKRAINIKKNDLSNPYRFKAVESWTVNNIQNINYIIYEHVGLAERINWGCDIVLLDGFKELSDEEYDNFYAKKLFKVNNTVYLANSFDYPFGDN